MRIRVVLSKPTLDLLWATSDQNLKWCSSEMPLQDGEAIVELDEDVMSQAIDLSGDETFDAAIRRLAHVKLAGGDV